MQKDLLTVEDITLHDLYDIFSLATVMKRDRETFPRQPLERKSVGMVFSKSSTRTRVSFEVGIRELGGFSLFLTQNDLQMGRGESIGDTARVLSRYLHGIVIRTHKHLEVVELAKHSHIPVINALTNDFHPCQILTDLFTIFEFSEEIEGVKMAFLGDCASNVANSLVLAAKLANMELTMSSPEAYRPDRDMIEDGNIGKGIVNWNPNPLDAVKDADYIYTDAWVSMGFEEESKGRKKALTPYQVNKKIVDSASAGVKLMHCLPAHRGEEITDEVLDSHQSIAFDQAENRLHVQKAIMTMLLDENWRKLLK